MSHTKENARRQPGADTTSNYAAKHSASNAIKQRTKNLIIAATCWRMIPPSFTEWLIHRLHLREA